MTEDHPWTLGTCSWAEFHPDMGVPVRISLGIPRWGNAIKHDASISELTPRHSYFRDPLVEFNRKYRQQLEGYGVEHLGRIFTTLTELASGNPLILLCFEKKAINGQVCHRRLFAEWWEEKTGEHIPELGYLPPEVPRTITPDEPLPGL